MCDLAHEKKIKNEMSYYNNETAQQDAVGNQILSSASTDSNMCINAKAEILCSLTRGHNNHENDSAYSKQLLATNSVGAGDEEVCTTSEDKAGCYDTSNEQQIKRVIDYAVRLGGILLQLKEKPAGTAGKLIYQTWA